MHRNFRKQSGFTLIEISIVIAIALILVLGGITFGSRMMMSANVTSETENVGMLITNVRNLHQKRYANLTVAQAITLNLVPTDLINGNAIEGHFGAITLAPGQLTGGGANTAMVITLNNVPPDACTQLAPALLGFADELDVGATANIKSRVNPRPARDTVAAACGVASVNIVLRAS
jgi:prepilin-type N-terminal cleavage/methylation domain-containing protein